MISNTIKERKRMFASLLAYPLLLPGSSPVPVSDAATMVSSSTWMTAMMMVTVMVMMMVVMTVMGTWTSGAACSECTSAADETDCDQCRED